MPVRPPVHPGVEEDNAELKTPCLTWKQQCACDTLRKCHVWALTWEPSSQEAPSRTPRALIVLSPAVSAEACCCKPWKSWSLQNQMKQTLAFPQVVQVCSRVFNPHHLVCPPCCLHHLALPIIVLEPAHTSASQSKSLKPEYTTGCPGSGVARTLEKLVHGSIVRCGWNTSSFFLAFLHLRRLLFHLVRPSRHQVPGSAPWVLVLSCCDLAVRLLLRPVSWKRTSCSRQQAPPQAC